MNKRHAGSALTSVIMMFFLVTLIGVPLLGMVIYNYRLREYDSGIKEAEYKNEIVMDRIATIIKNEVISAISVAKNTSTENITPITEALINSYNASYDDAVDAADSAALIDSTITEEEKNEILKTELKNNLKNSINDVSGTSKDELVGILNLDEAEDLSKGKIDNKKLQQVCNSIFQRLYQQELISNLFSKFYVDSNYSDMADIIVYGNDTAGDTRLKDESTGKTVATSLRIMAKYDYLGKDAGFNHIYDGDDISFLSFDASNELCIGIEVRYKMNTTIPVTTLSATYIIGTPEFSSISSMEQQTVALSNPILDYSLVVGDTLTLNGNTYIDGNILSRANGIKKENIGEEEVIFDKGIVLNAGSSLIAGRKVGSDIIIGSGRIATPGDIIMDTNTSKKTILQTGSNPIYYRNLYLGDPNNQKSGGEIEVTFNGDVLAKDDLEINLNSPGVVNVSQTAGNYFGYNDVNDDGPDSSSAIVINSSLVDKIQVNLQNLYLAGRAFIEGVKSTTRVNPITNENMIYKTGESISVKGNYIAYQTPIIGSGDYDGDGIVGDYDVDKVKFSPYFMRGMKNGIDTETNLTINLVDNFIPQISYDTFDSESKWKYFLEYALKNPDSIKIPNISIADVKHIQGVGINTNKTDKLIGQKIAVDESFKISKANKFEEFTRFFGYYPEDETKRKDSLSDWILVKDSIKAQDGQFFVYVSKEDEGEKTLAWGTGNSTGEDIYIKLPADSSSVNGIIIYNGDLKITNNCSSQIPFNGMMVVTGNLIIEGDVKITTDKDITSNIVIQNYLGNFGYIYTDDGNSLDKGDLLDIFVYDESGTIYVAIDVTDRSNVIDINKLVGVTDWKKTNFGRV